MTTKKENFEQGHSFPQTTTLERGGITYIVVHEVSNTAKETATEKVRRLILRDVERTAKKGTSSSK